MSKKDQRIDLPSFYSSPLPFSSPFILIHFFPHSFPVHLPPFPTSSSQIPIRYRQDTRSAVKTAAQDNRVQMTGLLRWPRATYNLHIYASVLTRRRSVASGSSGHRVHALATQPHDCPPAPNDFVTPPASDRQQQHGDNRLTRPSSAGHRSRRKDSFWTRSSWLVSDSFLTRSSFYLSPFSSCEGGYLSVRETPLMSLYWISINCSVISNVYIEMLGPSFLDADPNISELVCTAFDSFLYPSGFSFILNPAIHQLFIY